MLFHYVEAEQPYYISEEITVSQWKKTMQQSPKDTQKNLATGMSRNERARFAEIWSLETGEALIVATAEHIEKARAQGLISASMPDTGKKHQSIRRTQRKRKAVSALSPWTELVGVRLSKPDDPVLLEYRKDDDDSQPCGLCSFIPYKIHKSIRINIHYFKKKCILGIKKRPTIAYVRRFVYFCSAI